MQQYQLPLPPPVEQPLNKFYKAAWFILIGWWLGALWLILGYFLCITLLFLPLGLYMMRRLPGIITVQPPGLHFHAQMDVKISPDGARVIQRKPKSTPWYLRVPYFLLFGWWFGFFWCLAGYVLCLLVFPMPVGIGMLKRVPEVIALDTPSHER